MGIVIQLENARLLRNAVFPLLYLSTKARVFCTRDALSLQINDEDHAVVAVLQFNFDLYCCNDRNNGCIAGVDIFTLNNKLASTRVRDSVTIYAGWSPKNLIWFVIHDAESRGLRHELIFTEDVPKNSYYEDESACIYKMIVGVPSENFRQILQHMDWEGAPGSELYAHVTEEEVRFTSGEEEAVLTKQSGRCIIGGVGEDELVDIRICFRFIQSYIEAAKLSPVVWMLSSGGVGGVPDMLYCPIGPQMLGGSIKYYTPH